jgi:hypothetical protein
VIRGCRRLHNEDNQNDEVKEDEIGTVCSTHGEKGRGLLENLDIFGNVIIKLIVER